MKDNARHSDSIADGVGQAYEDVKNAGGESSKELARDFERMKANFSDLRNDISKLMSGAMSIGRDTKNVASDKASSAYSSAKDGASHLQDSSRDVLLKLEDRIRENPTTSALIALGAGYLVARLFRSR